ncbi:hypothetical protein F4808DRAFT_440361 [Astrocystis sublimbata]|nr:hypothetical protein F4808DRAFT_440361 [Astrocystis sublimbata]
MWEKERELERQLREARWAASSASSSCERLFPKFAHLPAELRFKIWRLAVPSPGINFFNVHAWPNDHWKCDRSTSPPLLYLDLRRLAIEDKDDKVASYDPSAWQARLAVRQSCAEAYHACALRPSEAATLTLTRPRRGLFVRPGDLQLRTWTPLNYGETCSMSHGTGRVMPKEPAVCRTVEVHIDDVLCLSVENCSLNLPWEEDPVIDEDEEGSDVCDGWSYDPELTPGLPPSIRPELRCVSLGNSSNQISSQLTDALVALLGEEREEGSVASADAHPPLLQLMFDSDTVSQQDSDASNLSLAHIYDEDGIHDWQRLEPTPKQSLVVTDRFGDRYVRLGTDNHLSPRYELVVSDESETPYDFFFTKMSPETNHIRERYRWSAVLHEGPGNCNGLWGT